MITRLATRRATRAAAAVLFLVACAKIEPPPGAPPDIAPPLVLEVRPDSVALLPGFDGEVEFIFDEVISEGATPNQGTGTGDLERLILLSPSEQVPQVRWKRNRITVKPKGGWQPDRVYRIELRPGVVDLRRNRSDTTVVVTLSTAADGAAVPDHRLQGRVFDWTRGQAIPGGLVVAQLLPDSLAYRVIADSTGRFSLTRIPDGTYVVFGVVDANRNARRDAREMFDSLRVEPGRTDVGEIWAFPHDTIGPRIQNAVVLDSVRATITLSQFLDPEQQLDSTAARVFRLPDSTPVVVRSVLPPAVSDSLENLLRAAADTVAQADSPDAGQNDVAPSPPPPLPRPEPSPDGESRPPLSDRLILRVGEPWVPGGRYFIELLGVRNVNGVAADASTGLLVPEPSPPPPPPIAPEDGLDAAPDSLPGAGAAGAGEDP